jgi:hypothetical protein
MTFLKILRMAGGFGHEAQIRHTGLDHRKRSLPFGAASFPEWAVFEASRK